MAILIMGKIEDIRFAIRRKINITFFKDENQKPEKVKNSLFSGVNIFLLLLTESSQNCAELYKKGAIQAVDQP